MENMMLLAIFIPLIGAFLLPLAGVFSPKVRNALALILVTASFGASASLVSPVLLNQFATFTISIPLGFDLILNADALGVFMA